MSIRVYELVFILTTRFAVEETVKRLCPDESDGPAVLNVGFGLGMIDTLFQTIPKPPRLHVIIEAHPDVLAHMRSKGVLALCPLPSL